MKKYAKLLPSTNVIERSVVKMENDMKVIVPGNSLVMTYGSLKAGFWNHRLIEGARFVGNFRTEPEYKIYCNGRFPYMIEVKENGVAVECEVYEVTPQQVANMDRLEGHPNWYRRKLVKLQGIEDVEGYVYQQNVGNAVDVGTSWPAAEEKQAV